jgi:hypothetical protein
MSGLLAPAMRNALFACLFALLLSQCNSVQSFGGAPNPPVKTLAIVKNDAIFMEELQPEIVRQVRDLGIQAELVDQAPEGDGYSMTYTANWAWDLAMYLRYFKASLQRGSETVGSVEYNTSSYDMGKFGRTADKVRPLLQQLLLGELLEEE